MENREFIRYASIVYIIKETEKYGYRLGRTALVKLIYILQEKFNVPIGYDFSLYTYGPFAKEILDDLDYLSFLDAAKIKMNNERYNILPGEDLAMEYIYEKAGQFIEENKDTISDVVKEFGQLSAKSLELITTIHYVINDYKESNINFTKEDISKLIHEIKPYFSEDEIIEKIDELESSNFVKLI
ncbi:DUF4065 domain-containing protein [Thermoanaerobacterium thermosaccharolyticum]|uniref:type II toxin-antitoxin system antitoxin SocA domain-containing protein n=1 Tax=Thermoanaerobacterium thermosaccharolyticum TaxID=1517 RepID=UPI003DA9F81A